MAERIKYITSWKKIRIYFLRRFPRRRHLRGTFLHRVIGEQLFDPRIWKPSRKGVAGGLAAGLFIAFTPTMGVQMILAGMAAYFLRVNISLALIACWITNPLTAPAIYPLQYKLGLWLSGTPTADELAEYTGMLKNFVRYAKPLWVGSLVSATFCSILAYAVIFAVWEWIARLTSKRNDPKQ